MNKELVNFVHPRGLAIGYVHRVWQFLNVDISYQVIALEHKCHGLKKKKKTLSFLICNPASPTEGTCKPTRWMTRDRADDRQMRISKSLQQFFSSFRIFSRKKRLMICIPISINRGELVNNLGARCSISVWSNHYICTCGAAHWMCMWTFERLNLDMDRLSIIEWAFFPSHKPFEKSKLKVQLHFESTNYRKLQKQVVFTYPETFGTYLRSERENRLEKTASWWLSILALTLEIRSNGETSINLPPCRCCHLAMAYALHGEPWPHSSFSVFIFRFWILGLTD